MQTAEKLIALNARITYLKAYLLEQIQAITNDIETINSSIIGIGHDIDRVDTVASETRSLVDGLAGTVDSISSIARGNSARIRSLENDYAATDQRVQTLESEVTLLRDLDVYQDQGANPTWWTELPVSTVDVQALFPSYDQLGIDVVSIRWDKITTEYVRLWWTSARANSLASLLRSTINALTSSFPNKLLFLQAVRDIADAYASYLYNKIRQEAPLWASFFGSSQDVERNADLWSRAIAYILRTVMLRYSWGGLHEN